MTAATIRSTTRILRPNAIGKCIEAGVYVPYESPRFLKVGTYHTGSSADYGVSILGIFNISEQSLTELVPLRDFDGVTEEGKEYIIRAHPSGEISPPMSLSSEFSVVELALDTKGWNILTAYPLYSPPSSGERTDIAVLGLIGKMTGAAAVVGTPVFESRDMGAVRVNVTVKALGVLGMSPLYFYISRFPSPSPFNHYPNSHHDTHHHHLEQPNTNTPMSGIYISTLPPSSVLLDHTMVLIRNQPIPAHTVRVAGDNDKVLEIDVEAAWREMGLEAGWGNEVGVEVVVR